MTWVSIDNIKSKYKMELDDDTITASLVFSEETIIKTVFIQKNWQIRGSLSQYAVPGPIMNITGDPEGILSTSDIEVYQVVKGQFINQETDLHQYLSSVENQYTQSLLTFTTTIPLIASSGAEVYARYRQGKDTTENMLIHLRRLEELLCIDWLFSNVSIDKLQEGIKAWTLNGVTVNFDLDAMQKVKAQNRIEEKAIWNLIRAVRADSIGLGTVYYDSQQKYLHGATWR